MSSEEFCLKQQLVKDQARLLENKINSLKSEEQRNLCKKCHDEEGCGREHDIHLYDTGICAQCGQLSEIVNCTIACYCEDINLDAKEFWNLGLSRVYRNPNYQENKWKPYFTKFQEHPRKFEHLIKNLFWLYSALKVKTSPILNIVYTFLAMYLTIPGLERIAKLNIPISNFVRFNIYMSIMVSTLVYAINYVTNSRKNYVNTLIISVFFGFVTLFGFLGYEEQYLYFVGGYFALAGFLKVVPLLYLRKSTY